MSTAQVRSPFPTLQLLLTKDLEWARRQWQLREDRTASRLPGALGLLSANKEMLREKVLCSIFLCEWVPSVSMNVHAGGHRECLRHARACDLQGGEVLAGLMDGLSSARDVSVRMNK